MKIFLPFKKDISPYLDEFLAHSTHSFVYDNYTTYNPSIKILNIHRLEAIFNWHKPTLDQLIELEKAI